MALFPSLPTLEELVAGGRFLLELPSFLRHPVSLEEARATLRRRLEHREDDFLELARRTIYEQPTSPYLQLLQVAGCEYGDLERLVDEGGVEGALQALYRRGVYLTVDEFRGRRPAVRGSAVLATNPTLLRNPLLRGSIQARSGGTRSAGFSVPVDLAHDRARAVDLCLELAARGGQDWVYAMWGVPGSSIMGWLLYYTHAGARPARWFSHVDPAAPGLDARYRWSGRLLIWASGLAGRPLPGPEYGPLEDPLPIAYWMRGVLESGQTPHLHSFVSPAVRLCRVALAAGIDLAGVQFSIVGEPITGARMAEIYRVGAKAVPDYCAGEAGSIARGCLAPDEPDEVHAFLDLNALIQPGEGASPAGLPPQALLISSLRSTARFILLNVSLGDQAVMTRRSCGCPMEELGWTTHLHTIRSFEKLTAGGMTFLGTDVIRVLEEDLPTRFGGGPADYQLVEDEDEHGEPHVRLLAHPAVGPLDERAVADAFLAAMGRSFPAAGVMELMWRGAGYLQVERQPPFATESGKIQHLHLLGRRQSG